MPEVLRTHLEMDVVAALVDVISMSSPPLSQLILSALDLAPDTNDRSGRNHHSLLVAPLFSGCHHCAVLVHLLVLLTEYRGRRVVLGQPLLRQEVLFVQM